MHGYAISFGIGDYLHVMERYDQNWWIGRKVQDGADIGFIPSPAKLETLRVQLAQSKTAKMYSSNKQSSSANLNKFLYKSRDSNKSVAGSTSGNGGASEDGDEVIEVEVDLAGEIVYTVFDEQKWFFSASKSLSFCRSSLSFVIFQGVEKNYWKLEF